MWEHSKRKLRNLASSETQEIIGYVAVSKKAKLKERYLSPFLLLILPEEIVILFVLLEVVVVEVTAFSQLICEIRPVTVNRLVSFLILSQSRGSIPRIFGAEYISHPSVTSISMCRPRKWGQVTSNSTTLLRNICSKYPYL